jgi:hypothetical protein
MPGIFLGLILAGDILEELERVGVEFKHGFSHDVVVGGHK